MKHWFLAGFGVAFGAVMAYLIGSRMSQDAMAIVVGMACGGAIGVPVALVLVALAARARRSEP